MQLRFIKARAASLSGFADSGRNDAAAAIPQSALYCRDPREAAARDWWAAGRSWSEWRPTGSTPTGTAAFGICCNEAEKSFVSAALPFLRQNHAGRDSLPAMSGRRYRAYRHGLPGLRCLPGPSVCAAEICLPLNAMSAPIIMREHRVTCCFGLRSAIALNWPALWQSGCFARLKAGWAGIFRLSPMFRAPYPVRSGRGYCPARLLAEALSPLLGVPILEVLRRRTPRQQKFLSAAGRWENAKTGYALRRGAGAGGKILLIDDLTTTGATLSACASLLKEAGAESVFCATFAITPKKS